MKNRFYEDLFSILFRTIILNNLKQFGHEKDSF